MKILRMTTWLAGAVLSLIGWYAVISTAMAAERPINGKEANQIQRSSTAYALEVLENGALNLNAEEAPLGHLLEEIHQKTDLKFTIHQKPSCALGIYQFSLNAHRRGNEKNLGGNQLCACLRQQQSP
jgi:hypothetical protein